MSASDSVAVVVVIVVTLIGVMLAVRMSLDVTKQWRAGIADRRVAEAERSKRILQAIEHDTLDPRPVLLWAHEDCPWCRTQARGETFRELRRATTPIPGDSRRR